MLWFVSIFAHNCNLRKPHKKSPKELNRVIPVANLNPLTLEDQTRLPFMQNVKCEMNCVRVYRAPTVSVPVIQLMLMLFPQ